MPAPHPKKHFCLFQLLFVTASPVAWRVFENSNFRAVYCYSVTNKKTESGPTSGNLPSATVKQVNESLCFSSQSQRLCQHSSDFRVVGYWVTCWCLSHVASAQLCGEAQTIVARQCQLMVHLQSVLLSWGKHISPVTGTHTEPLQKPIGNYVPPHTGQRRGPFQRGHLHPLWLSFIKVSITPTSECPHQ